jgi:hypothetical protein
MTIAHNITPSLHCKIKEIGNLKASPWLGFLLLFAPESILGREAVRACAVPVSIIATRELAVAA